VYHIRWPLTPIGRLAPNKAGGAMRYTRESHRRLLSA
jgi:hypothetical protein